MARKINTLELGLTDDAHEVVDIKIDVDTGRFSAKYLGTEYRDVTHSGLFEQLRTAEFAAGDDFEWVPHLFIDADKRRLDMAWLSSKLVPVVQRKGGYHTALPQTARLALRHSYSGSDGFELNEEDQLVVPTRPKLRQPKALDPETAETAGLAMALHYIPWTETLANKVQTYLRRKAEQKEFIKTHEAIHREASVAFLQGLIDEGSPDAD